MRYIDTREGLSEVLNAVRSSEWVAVDTEADSLHHYAEKLSLVQITAAGEDFVVDPLVPDLPVQDLLDKIAAQKIYFHAADSDVRLLKKAYRFSPREVFDTMIAAQLLGYDKIGLQNLAERHCGVKLSKAEQKADWSERPLEQKLLDYAANDTHYLEIIAKAMRQELRDLGREDWHRQQCARLLETLENLKESEDRSETAWQVKGARHLKGLPLTMVRELWYWRDALARKRDRPSFKVLNTDFLVDLAVWAAAHPGVDIAEWAEAPRHLKRDHRDELNALLSRAKDAPPAVIERTGGRFPRRKWTEKENALVGNLKTARDKYATELKIQPSLIANNAVLETLAAEKPGSPDAIVKATGLLPWQMDLIGEDFLKVLSA